MSTRRTTSFRPGLERVESRQLLSAGLPAGPASELHQEVRVHHPVHLPHHPTGHPHRHQHGGLGSGNPGGRPGATLGLSFAYHLYAANPPAVYAFSVTNQTGQTIALTVTHFDQNGVPQNVIFGPPSAPVPQVSESVPAGGSILLFTDSPYSSFQVTASTSGPFLGGSSRLLANAGTTTSPAAGFIYPENSGWPNDLGTAQSKPYVVIQNSTTKPTALLIQPA